MKHGKKRKGQRDHETLLLTPCHPSTSKREFYCVSACARASNAGHSSSRSRPDTFTGGRKESLYQVHRGWTRSKQREKYQQIQHTPYLLLVLLIAFEWERVGTRHLTASCGNSPSKTFTTEHSTQCDRLVSRPDETGSNSNRYRYYAKKKKTKRKKNNRPTHTINRTSTRQRDHD